MGQCIIEYETMIQTLILIIWNNMNIIVSEQQKQSNIKNFIQVCWKGLHLADIEEWMLVSVVVIMVESNWIKIQLLACIVEISVVPNKQKSLGTEQNPLEPFFMITEKCDIR